MALSDVVRILLGRHAPKPVFVNLWNRLNVLDPSLDDYALFVLMGYFGRDRFDIYLAELEEIEEEQDFYQLGNLAMQIVGPDASDAEDDEKESFPEGVMTLDYWYEFTCLRHNFYFRPDKLTQSQKSLLRDYLETRGKWEKFERWRAFRAHVKYLRKYFFT